MSRYLSIAKSTIAFAIPQVSARLLSILVLPLYTRFLSTADYGTLELLDLTFYFFSYIWGAQISSAIFYHLGKRGDAPEGNVFSTALIGASILGVTGSSIGFLLAGTLSQWVMGSADYTNAFRLTLAAFAFGPLIESGFAILRAHDQVAMWNRLSVVRGVMQAVLTLFFLAGPRWGYMSNIYSNLTVSAALGIWFLFDYYRRSPIRFDFKLYLGILKYTIPLGVGGIATLTIHYGDRFFLQRFVPLSAIGIYSLAYKIGMLTTFVHTPFTIYWSVERFKVARDKDGDQFYVRIFTYLVLVLTGAGILINATSPIALRLLVPESYYGAAVYIPWVTLAYVLRSIGDHLRGTLFVEGRTSTESKVSLVGAAVCLASYALLIPRFRVAGAVASTLLAFLVFAVISFVAGQRARHFRFEYRRLALIVLAAAVSSLPQVFIHSAGIGEQCLLALLSVLLFPLALYLTRFVTDSEKETLVLALQSLRG